jgi:flagella basal body P-ring formation protein FlgA
MIRAAVLFFALAGPACAETIIAARTLPAGTIIGAGDLALSDSTVPGGLSDPALLIGQESRVALYAGRPIRAGDIGAPAIVERNQIITLTYTGAGITILAEGRALDRGGIGDRIRVMNVTSRTTITATLTEDGSAHVQN